MKTTSILRTATINDITKQFKEAGYEVDKTAETLIVKLDGVEVLRALTSSNSKTWLTRYESNLLTATE